MTTLVIILFIIYGLCAVCAGGIASRILWLAHKDNVPVSVGDVFVLYLISMTPIINLAYIALGIRYLRVYNETLMPGRQGVSK